MSEQDLLRHFVSDVVVAGENLIHFLIELLSWQQVPIYMLHVSVVVVSRYALWQQNKSSNYHVLRDLLLLGQKIAWRHLSQ
jgi:hypothetical protein